MTVEEIKKKIMEFENMMGDYHNTHTRYDRWGLSWYSSIMNAFGKNKEKEMYNQLLEDIKLVYNQMEYKDYMQLRHRIIAAYEA